jgi:hypothetical protein
MAKFKIGHHSSDWGTGGRSEFERQQLALQQTIRRLGYDRVPVNDETLRPFLKALWDFAKGHHEKVWTFDTPGQGPPGRLYMGLVGGMTIIHPLSRSFQAKLLTMYSRAEIERAKPVFQLGKGGQCTLYFEGVWVPAEALDGRTH